MKTVEERQQERERNVAEIKERICTSDETIMVLDRVVKCIDADLASGYCFTGSGLVFYAGKIIERIDWAVVEPSESDFERDTVSELVADHLTAYAIEDERERYAATSSVGRRTFNFVNANDLTYSPSDLIIKKDGEWRYARIRRLTRARRQQMANVAGL